MILPRYIRYRDAPGYLGIDRNKFDADVRPALTEIPIGERGIAFDRLDLDAWADDYKNRNGRPSRKLGNILCEQGQKASKSSKVASRLSTRSTGEGESLPDSAQSVKTKRKFVSVKSSKGSTSNLAKARNALSALLPVAI